MFVQLIAALLIASAAVLTPGDSRLAATAAQWHLLRQAEPGQNLTSITCPGVHTCYVAGSVVLRTRDRGSTWRTLVEQVPGTSSGITCPSTTMCFVSTKSGNLLVTRNGGAAWSQLQLSSRPLGPIACPTLRTCYVLVFPCT